MVTACEGFPAGTPYWEVVLASEKLFWFLVFAVAKVCGVDGADVDSEAFFGEADRSGK